MNSQKHISGTGSKNYIIRNCKSRDNNLEFKKQGKNQKIQINNNSNRFE